MYFRKIIFLYVAVCLTACTSWVPIQPETAPGALRPGEEVEIETVDGDLYKFVVDSVTGRGIGGNGHFIVYDDIKKISHRKADPEETIMLTTLIVLLTAIGAAVADDLLEGFFGSDDD